jgi:hypothetical protein
MTFSEAVVAVVREEVAPSPGRARTRVKPTARYLGLTAFSLHRWLAGRGRPSADAIDAAVVTYGLARIVEHLDHPNRIALYGACESCGERPKAMRGLLRHCSRCRRLTGSSGRQGSEVPS